MCAERIHFDTLWHVYRGKSVIMEGYRDEISTKKGQAARTVVRRMDWLSLGERNTFASPARAQYATKLLGAAKSVLEKAKDYSGQLPKVTSLSFCIALCPLPPHMHKEVWPFNSPSSLVDVLRGPPSSHLQAMGVLRPVLNLPPVSRELCC